MIVNVATKRQNAQEENLARDAIATLLLTRAPK